VAGWRLSGLPKGLEPDQLRRLLASCDRRTPTGRRDYAIMLLLARLGLRAGEVARLGLDDIDWRSGEITIVGKGNRAERLPLPVDVGAAIAAYLRHGRRATAEQLGQCGLGRRDEPSGDRGLARRGRHLNFYDSRDNLPTQPGGLKGHAAGSRTHDDRHCGDLRWLGAAPQPPAHHHPAPRPR
jgi:integrase